MCKGNECIFGGDEWDLRYGLLPESAGSWRERLRDSQDLRNKD